MSLLGSLTLAAAGGKALRVMLVPGSAKGAWLQRSQCSVADCMAVLMWLVACAQHMDEAN